MSILADQAQSLLKTDSDLFGLVLDFNKDIGRYIHPSHFLEIPHPVVQTILDSQRSADRFSQKILSHFKLSDSYTFDFSNKHYRMALLDAQTLKNLSLYAGATIYSAELKTIIKKEKVSELRLFLSEKIYSFAIKKTMLFLRYAPPREVLAPEPIDIRDKISQAGLICLKICLSGAPSAILDRFKLKFPASTDWNFPKNPTEELRVKTFSLLSKLLSREMKSPFVSCLS